MDATCTGNVVEAVVGVETLVDADFTAGASTCDPNQRYARHSAMGYVYHGDRSPTCSHT